MHSSLLTAGDTTTLLIQDSRCDLQIQVPECGFGKMLARLEEDSDVLAQFAGPKYEIEIMGVGPDNYEVQFCFFMARGQSATIPLSASFTLTQLKKLFNAN